MRRAVAVVLIALGSVVVPARPAAACSCVWDDPRAALAEADAAFVGRSLGRTTSPGGTVVHRYAVDLAVKGDVAATIDVTEEHAGMCWLQAPVGERIGLLLRGSEGSWRAGQCDDMPPDVLARAGGRLPVPDGTPPAAWLVGGSVDGHRLVAVDGEGRTVAYGGGDGRLSAAVLCPGAEVAAEVASIGDDYVVARRRVDTLDVLDQWPLVRSGPPAGAPYVTAVACRDGEGREVLVHLTDGPMAEQSGRVVLLRDGALTEVAATPGGWAAFGPDGSVAYVAGEGRVTRVDLSSGTTAAVAVASEVTGVPVVSPDGNRLAFAGSTRVVLVDLTANPAAVRIDGGVGSEDAHGSVVWADARTLVYSPGAAHDDRVVVYDRELRRLGEFGGWEALDVAVVDGTLVGVAAGRLLAAPLPGGPVRELRRWDSPSTSVLLSLRPPPPAPVRPAPGVVAKGATVGGASWPATGVAAAAGLAAAGGVAQRRRRRAAGWGSSAPASALAAR